MEPIKFLDYTITNSSDGIVLVDKNGCNAMPGACCFGKGDSGVSKAKKAAVLLFMIARPEKFDGSLYWRLSGRGGAYHEWFILRRALQEDGIEIPKELLEPADNLNFMIGFNKIKI